MKRLFNTGSVLILSLLLLIFTPQKTSGQNNALWGGVGIQASSMDDLKYLQELILDAYPVQGEIISSFPAFTMASFGWINQRSPTIRIGVGYGFSATGAKTNYTDYSGSLTSLISAESHRLGAFGSYSLLRGDWFELSVIGRFEIKYSRVDISSDLYVLGASGILENSYKSWSPGGAGGAEFLFHLKDISFGLEGGYEIDAQGKLTSLEDNEELTDPNDPDHVLTTNWTGWYAQAKFILWLDF